MAGFFKSKANDTYCLYNSYPMVRYYALQYGFYVPKSVEKDTWPLFVYKWLTFDLSEDLSESAVYRQVIYEEIYSK